MSVARIGLTLSSNRLRTDVSVATAAKSLDVQKAQGQMIVELIQTSAVVPSNKGNLLDTMA